MTHLYHNALFSGFIGKSIVPNILLANFLPAEYSDEYPAGWYLVFIFAVMTTTQARHHILKQAWFRISRVFRAGCNCLPVCVMYTAMYVEIPYILP